MRLILKTQKLLFGEDVHAGKIALLPQFCGINPLLK